MEIQEQINPVADLYRFRSNEYYLSLIDWNDPDDPIRRIIIPNLDELEPWGSLDPSDESSVTVLPGLEHKYDSTALLLVSNVCGGICRFCFRKRVFLNERERADIVTNMDLAKRYINNHKEITNVLLTGGDPLSLSTKRLASYIDTLSMIDHVQIIRIGTKMLGFNPYRILNDPELPEVIQNTMDKGKQVYIMTHFNHPREITDLSIQAARILQHTGAVLANQTPLLRGVNNDPDILADLFRKLSFIGIPPYYIFQCRPSSGNHTFSLPIETGYELFELAKSKVSGLAKRARFAMSHRTGKIEILGLTDDQVFMKYHRARDSENDSCFMVYPRNPHALWLDDYDEPVQKYPIDDLITASL